MRALTHLHLDRLCVAALHADVLSALPALTHLYIQHNRLTSLEPLAAAPQLQFVAASHNWLETVRSICHDCWYLAWRAMPHKDLCAQKAAQSTP